MATSSSEAQVAPLGLTPEEVEAHRQEIAEAASLKVPSPKKTDVKKQQIKALEEELEKLRASTSDDEDLHENKAKEAEEDANAKFNDLKDAFRDLSAEMKDQKLQMVELTSSVVSLENRVNPRHGGVSGNEDFWEMQKDSPNGRLRPIDKK